jgi:hypothetical protein
MNIEIDLAFYIVGIPGYKMEKYIGDFLTLYTDLLSEISINTQKYTNQAYKFQDGEKLLAIQNLQ